MKLELQIKTLRFFILSRKFSDTSTVKRKCLRCKVKQRFTKIIAIMYTLGSNVLFNALFLKKNYESESVIHLVMSNSLPPQGL